jgi:hypothetical protein
VAGIRIKSALIQSYKVFSIKNKVDKGIGNNLIFLAYLKSLPEAALKRVVNPTSDDFIMAVLHDYYKWLEKRKAVK